MKYGFMAGCSLSSSSPEHVKQVIEYLKHFYPDLAVIQSCCGRPLKMIGQEDKFQSHFATLAQQVKAAGIDELLVACQSCLKTMRAENQFAVGSLWVKMAELGLPKAAINKAKDSTVKFSVQDSCTARNEPDIQRAVRELIHTLGYETVSDRLSRRNTLCCGMGGMCGVSNANLSKEAAHHRVESFKSDYIVTYCSSCAFAMAMGGGKAWHLLDLIFGDVVHEGDKAPEQPLGSPIKAWINRYRSKKIVNEV